MTTVIYFALLATGEIKIGCTKDVRKRIPTLARQYGGATLIGTVVGDYIDERIMHNRFRPYWIEGELFMPNAEIFALAGAPELYKPDPRYADRLPQAAWKSAFGRMQCKFTMSRREWASKCYERFPWWYAFYPPALPVGKIFHYPEGYSRRWVRTTESFYDRGGNWYCSVSFAQLREEARDTIVRNQAWKYHSRLKAQFSEPWLRAIADADVTRRYLARQARLARPRPAR